MASELMTAYLTLMPKLSDDFGQSVESQATKGVNSAAVGVGLGKKMASGFVKGFASIGVGKMIGGVLSSSIEAGREFDASMSQVAATMGTTVDQIGDLRDFAQEMGATTKFSASESADALNYMALAGYDAQTSMKMLPNVLNLAAAGNIDLAYASDMVTDTQSALGLSLEQTTKLVDKMAATSSKTNTNVAQLGEGLLTVGGTAKTMSGGTTEAAQALGLLADNGVKGAEGGTALRNILLGISSDKFAEKFGKLGVAAYDASGNMRSLKDIFADMNTAMKDMTVEQKTEALSTAFNKVDLKSVNALLATSSERWDEVAAAIDGSAGAAERMAGTQLDNLEGDITTFNSALEGTRIALSDSLTPALRELVQSGTQGLGELTKYFKTEEFKTFAKNVAGGIAASVRGIAGALKFFAENGDKVMPIVIGLGGAFLVFKTVSGAAIGIQAISAVLPAIGAGGGVAAGGLTAAAAAESAAGAGAAAAAPSLLELGGAVLMIGGGVALAAGGIWLLADAAIRLSDAGGDAVPILIGLGVGVVALMGAAALLGPMLTAGAVGMIAFGAATLMVGAGIAVASAGIALVSTQLPIISQHGLQAAAALAALGVSAIVFGAGAIVAGAGLVVLGAGLLLAAPAMLAGAAGAAAFGAALGVIAAPIHDIGDSAERFGNGLINAGDGMALIASNAIDAGAAVLDFHGKLVDVTRQAVQSGNQIRSVLSGLEFWAVVNFEIGPLPHFRFSGMFNPKTGSVPAINVDWYSQGAIFKPNSPGLIGIGDAKVPEVAAPLDKLKDMIGGTSGDVNVYVTVNARDGQDAYDLGRQIGQATAYELRMQGVSA